MAAAQASASQLVRAGARGAGLLRAACGNAWRSVAGPGAGAARTAGGCNHFFTIHRLPPRHKMADSPVAPADSSHAPTWTSSPASILPPSMNPSNSQERSLYFAFDSSSQAISTIGPMPTGPTSVPEKWAMNRPLVSALYSDPPLAERVHQVAVLGRKLHCSGCH